MGEIDTHGREEESSSNVGVGDVCRAMEQLICKVFDSSHTEVAGRLALEITELHKAGAESNERPLYARQGVDIVKKYS
jgi:hypothetical protein